MKQVPRICFLNNKGGVAKTTCSSLIAEYASLELGKRVLLIDLDGQVNLSEHWLGVDENYNIPVHPDYDPEDPDMVENFNPRSTICDIYYGKSVMPYATFIGPSKLKEGIDPKSSNLSRDDYEPDYDDFTSPRVDIIPCEKNLMKEIMHGVVSNAITAEQLASQLERFCTDSTLSEIYDLIVIDSGPTESALFTACLSAATHIVTPYKPERYSIMGLKSITSSVARARLTGRSELEFIGFLPVMVSKAKGAYHTDKIQEMIAQFTGQHFPEGLEIPDSSQFSRRQDNKIAKPDSVFFLRKSNKVRQQAVDVFEYIAQRTFA